MLRRMFVILAGAWLVFGIIKLSFATSCGGHDMQGSKQPAQVQGGHEHGMAEAAKEAVPAAKGFDAGNKICPVSGQEVGQGGMEPATYEYEGKVYNFCCPMCIEDFKKDPQKYIKKVEQELQAGSESQTGHGEHQMQTMTGE